MVTTQILWSLQKLYSYLTTIFLNHNARHIIFYGKTKFYGYFNVI